MDLLSRVFIIALLAMPLAACDSNDGPAEKLGKDVDKALDNTRDAVDDAGDELKDGIEDTCEKVSDENC
jgi:predicted small secreted protein